jgi:drug/metabolite transporter (DMT)-like permease
MKLKDWVTFLALTLIWGASFLWIKIAVRDIGPVSLVAFRLFFGLAGLLAFFPVLRPKIPRERRVWVNLAILGVTSSALPWFFISWAETTIDSAIASVLNGTVPLFTMIVAHFALRDDKITAGRVLGLLLGFGGVVILSLRPATAGDAVTPPHPALSVVATGAMLLATFSYAIGAVHARRNLGGVSPLIQAFFSMAFSLVVILAVAIAVEGGPRVPARLDTWAALGWLGVLGAGIASYIFYKLLHSVGPTRASLVTYTLPVVGVTLGVIVLKERLDWRLVVGTLLIVSGVWVVNHRR